MLTIQLIGRPGLERDGNVVRPPRGRKSWALLAYLLLAPRSTSRRHLAEMLFADADDPLGALRWSLAELRRALGDSTILRGDPVSPRLGDTVVTDALLLQEGHLDHALLSTVDGDLLDGIELPDSHTFESWLLVERHRISAVLEACLRQRAVGLLVTGRAQDAVTYAVRALRRNPLEEANHELLVRSLAMSGDHAGASRQVAASQDQLYRELGVSASPALQDAATSSTAFAAPSTLDGRAAATSQLEAGRAAIVAGAVDAGVQCLRRAVVEAERCRDETLQAWTLMALGAALVHTVRGRDEEGVIALQSAIHHATQAGDRPTAVRAHYELAFVDVQAGRGRTADTWLAKAIALAETDGEHAAINGIAGMKASDRADYPTALDNLHASIDQAQRADDLRQQAWSQSILARAHLLRGDQQQARIALDTSLDLVRRERWLAFQPWPMALRAELDLATGDTLRAAQRLEHAWALARQLDDPCWESMAARGLGLLNAGRGNRDAADQWLTRAVQNSNRTPDRYQWVHAHALDTMITDALNTRPGDSIRPLVDQLETLAARCDLRELVAHAQLHRHQLGDDTALRAARLTASHIDNPRLHRLLDPPAPS